MWQSAHTWDTHKENEAQIAQLLDTRSAYFTWELLDAYLIQIILQKERISMRDNLPEREREREMGPNEFHWIQI